MVLTHSTVQVIYLPFCDSTEQQLHFLIDADNYAHLHPKTPEAAEIFQRESETCIRTPLKLKLQKADIKKRKTNENNAKKQLRRYLIHAPFEDQSMLASTVIPQSLSMAHAPFEDDVNTSFGRLPEPWPFVSCANKNRLSNNQQRGGSSHGNMNHVNSATKGFFLLFVIDSVTTFKPSFCRPNKGKEFLVCKGLHSFVFSSLMVLDVINSGINIKFANLPRTLSLLNHTYSTDCEFER
ncbi:hypothetical protein CTI12_AA450820 [Artemisia annua]|uniref:Uncharacterized protein n=1 Tax=Artemisia annua TaxID=35608 RepID=A0A2U1LV03_ARTAN|nr:hypothetical protein CTI12_AA450820 [Artemisia annua]